METTARLLPELQEWNNGNGITSLDWLYTEARSDFGVAFADLFWPTFVEFEGYVFREGFSVDTVRSWEGNGTDRKGVEAATNLLDTGDLFVPPGAEWSGLIEARAIHVGRILAETYRAKLARDFPGRTFCVEFYDGSEPGDDDIYVTFWQAPA
ncbi:hypothetical protein [Brevundimonas sp.]|uniref:hypothetical protein n=1 Tax=Brevundimonas sp. TaxID=1871086 RepID=UPI0025BC7979|nr:hypothetical protein [Brevundimonas sp.]